MPAPQESQLLQFYNLDSLTPSTWGSTSLLSNLNPNSNQHSIDTATNLALVLPNSKAVPSTVSSSTNINYSKDPLGFYDSILNELIDKDIIDDSRDSKKLKYLIDSKLFNPKLYLNTMHKEKSFDQLSQSLNYLDAQINRSSNDLKNILQKEFTKFITCKSFLDQFYFQFNDSNLVTSTKTITKGSSLAENENSKSPSHTDILSTSIQTSASSMNVLINPLFETNYKRDKYQELIRFIQDNKFYFNLSKTLQRHIENNDFKSLVSDYKLGKVQYHKLLKSNKEFAQILNKLNDQFESVINNHKEKLWSKLGLVHLENTNNNSISLFNDSCEFLTLIVNILQLNDLNENNQSIENPIIEFINLQNNYLLELIQSNQAKLSKHNEKQSGVAKSINLALNSLIESSLYNAINSTSTSSSASTPSSFQDLQIIKDSWALVHSGVLESIDLLNVHLLKFGRIIDYFVNNQLFKLELDQMGIKFTSKRMIDLVFNSSDAILNNNSYELLIYKTLNSLMNLFNSHFQYIPKVTTPISTLNYSIEFNSSINNSIRTLLASLDQNSSALISDKSEFESTLSVTNSKINQNLIIGALNSITDSNIYVKGIISSCLAQCGVLNSSSIGGYSSVYEGCTKFLEFMLHYYQFITDKLSRLINSSSMIYDREFITTVEDQFINSLGLMIDDIKEILSNEEVSETDKDSDNTQREMINELNDLNIMKIQIIPTVLKLFNSRVVSKLSNNDSKGNKNYDLLFVKLEQFELDLFNSLINIHKFQISEILSQGIKSQNWYISSPSSSSGNALDHQSPSGYVLQLVNLMNTLDIKLTDCQCSKVLSFKIYKGLTVVIIDKLKLNIREIKNFSSIGLIKLSIDLRFLRDFFTDRGGSDIGDDIAKLSKIYEKMISKLNPTDLQTFETTYQNVKSLNQLVFSN